MIEAFFGLKTKIYSVLVAENNDHKKAKGVNRNVAVIITHNGHNHVLFNNRCLRSSSKNNQEQQLFLKALIKKDGNMEKCQKIKNAVHYLLSKLIIKLG